MSINEVGEIRYFLTNHLNWNIPRFSDLPSKPGSRIWSPKFCFLGETKKFILYPVGFKRMSIASKLNVSLTFKSDVLRPIDGILRVGVTDENGKVRSTCNCVPKYDDGSFHTSTSIPESEILSRGTRGVPNGYLQLFCEILPGPCARTVDTATQTEDENGLVNLSENLKDLFLNHKDCDLTMNIQGQDFNVHRSILRARSEVFDAMLSHNVSENNENIIRIEDCEPGVFEEFLLFIYSGKTENITSDNVLGLYCAADKYNLPDLKNICLNFLKKNLSLENICEVICLAMKHEETELLDIAFNFFARNMDEILTTCNWLLFLKENPVEANEICIKGLKLGFTKIKDA